MPDERTPVQIADQVAEDLRTLNHMTLDHATIEYPGDFYNLIANLKLTADRMPQLFGQMIRWLQEEHSAGRIAHDHGGDVAEYVTAVVEALQRASQDADTLGASLDTAHEVSGGLKAAEVPPSIGL